MLLACLLGPAAWAQVPRPQPVPTDLRVGCYYFPGHFNAARWSPMKTYGSPTPLLGYYRDGAPDVFDWQIKWAVEHGISFLVFDWYYDYHAGRVSEHNTALDQGFLRAAYRDLLQFAIFWCNEEGGANPPYTREEMLLLGKTLGQRYLGQPNYLRIDGRPALFISEPGRLWNSFGEGFRELLPEISRAAGLPEGTTFFLVGKHSEALDHLAKMGFGACTAYNYAGDRTPDDGSPLRASYDAMLDAYEAQWRRVTEDGTLPYIVPISPGWDSRPWYGPRALVRTDPTADRFREMCERAKRYARPPLNMVVAECWNEFGEGSYLEPTEEFGFGALDALREAFCRPGNWPPNATPEAGRKAAWTFDAIPDDPQHLPPSAQAGDLLAEGDMEAGLGWMGFDHEPAEFSSEVPCGGKQCLALKPGGTKSGARAGLLFGREYEVSAWVRCSAGASVLVTSALFGRDGRWLGTYYDIGRAEAAEWALVSRRLPGLDPGIGAVDIEFVATGGACWADDAQVRLIGPLEVETVFADDGSGPNAWVLYDDTAPTMADGALRLPAGAGVKTRRPFGVEAGATYEIVAEVRCDEMATLTAHAAELDAEGRWLKAYAPIPGNSVSWPTWVEVTFSLAFGADTPARQCTIEFVALGGECQVRNVRVRRGGRLGHR